MVSLARLETLIDFPAPPSPVPKSNEWYTPARYVEAAREVMGGIDLDPASCELANMVVRAEKFYTEQENGLLQPWYGRVWLNPPYSALTSTRGLTGGKQEGPTFHFVDKLVRDYRQSKIEQAIVCLNADICRKWFQALWDFLICFSSKPISFNRPGRKPEHHFFSTAFIYLGPQEQRFVDIFSAFGTITKRVSHPVVRPINLPLWEDRR